MLPWIKTNSNPYQRAKQIVNRGKPLTTTYPQSTFAVTAQNGAPLAPGQSKWDRILPRSGFGDPRTTGGFYDITTDDNIQSLLTGGAPSSINIGGDSVGGPIPAADSNHVIWIVVGLIAFALFVK